LCYLLDTFLNKQKQYQKVHTMNMKFQLKSLNILLSKKKKKFYLAILWYFFVLLCWEFIVSFTKLPTMCQIYLFEFTPSTILLYPSPPHSYNSFNRPHCSIYRQVYRVFVPYLLKTFPLPYVPVPRQDLFCPSFSFFVKEKSDISVHLR
jgi:hypothetical protein